MNQSQQAAAEEAFYAAHPEFPRYTSTAQRLECAGSQREAYDEFMRGFAAALASSPQPAEPIMRLNGYQLRDALDFIAPDGTDEQLETEACIQHGPERTGDEGTEAAGMYCWDSEYPEEGAVRLGDGPEDCLASPPSAPAQVPGWQPIETAPKDGKPVLVRWFNDNPVVAQYRAAWAESPSKGWSADGVVLESPPDVWMPIPPLPPPPVSAPTVGKEQQS